MTLLNVLENYATFTRPVHKFSDIKEMEPLNFKGRKIDRMFVPLVEFYATNHVWFSVRNDDPMDDRQWEFHLMAHEFDRNRAIGQLIISRPDAPKTMHVRTVCVEVGALWRV